MSKCNAKEELWRELTDSGRAIICATIKSYEDDCDEDDCDDAGDGEVTEIHLRVGHTEEEFVTFLAALDFEYDNGWGHQELYGTVWLTNGEWLSRGEYDGSEWWDHNKLPEIPENLKGV